MWIDGWMKNVSFQNIHNIVKGQIMSCKKKKTSNKNTKSSTYCKHNDNTLKS